MPNACSFLVVAVLLAGCTTTQPTLGSQEASPTAATVTYEPSDALDGTAQPLAPGRGSLEGIATDSELVPLANVSVYLARHDNVSDVLVQASTDDSGAFRIDGLPEGMFAVFATKEGYQDSDALRVEVQEGATVRTDLVLAALAQTGKPHHATLVAKTQFTNVYCYKVPDLGQGPGAAQGSPGWHCGSGSNVKGTFLVVNENETGLLQTVVTELKWLPTYSACSTPWRVDTYSPNFGSKSAEETRRRSQEGDVRAWTSIPQSKSPLKVYIPREGTDPIAMHSQNRTAWNGGTPIETSGQWGAQNWYYAVDNLGTPVDVSCMLQQTADHAQSFFFNEPAPLSFSAFAS